MQTGDGGCTSPTPPPVNLNSPFSTVAVSKNTGQYQVAASAFLANPYAAGPLYKSSNYGASWTRIYIDGYWKKVAVSSDGHYMLAVELYGKAYESSDYGATWSDTGLGTHYFTGCAISSDGYYRTITIAQTSLSEFGKIKRSVNFGSWTDATTPSASTCSLNFNAIAMSSNGQYQTVVTGTGLETETNSPYGGGVLYSSDYGANFSLSFQGAYIFIDVTSSPDGTKQIVVYQSAYTGGNGGLFKSTNYGSSWSTLGGAGNWFRATANDTTTNYAIGGGTDYIKNIASLSTITDLTASGSRAWRCIDMDNSGTYILAGTTTNIYRSTNSGTSFTAL
jgi:hypothetical protein